MNHYLQKRVGYDFLAKSLIQLTSDHQTVDQTFGFVLSVSLNNFALSSIFVRLRSTNCADLAEYKPLFGTIQNASALKLLLELLDNVPAGDTILARSCYMAAEHLAGTNHRNKVLIGSMPILPLLFKRFSSMNSDDVIRPLLAKLLKRLVEIGLSVSSARLLFESAVHDRKTLNMDTLEIIRSGMKSRWPQHFSIEGPALLSFAEHATRSLPSVGFTFMVHAHL